MDRPTDAFVIWLDGGDASPTAFAGRIEHVQSAVRGSFASPQELLAFLEAHRRTVGALEGEDG